MENQKTDLSVLFHIALNTAHQFFHENDLVVNQSKTNQITLGRRATHVPTIPNVNMDYKAKFLGITQDMTWTPKPYRVMAVIPRLESSREAFKNLKILSRRTTHSRSNSVR